MHILLVPIFICLCAALKLPAKAITVKRGNPLSEGYYAAPADERLICVENGLPDNIFEPGGALARNAGYQRAIDVCSVRSHLTNMACRCVSGDEGEEMICGDGAMTVEDEEQDVMTYCYEACHCPGDRKKIYDATGNLVDFTSLADIEMFGNRTEPASPFQRAIDSLVERLGDECKSPTCTSVSRHCPCGTQCGAPKLTIFFWRSGHCWPTRTQAIQLGGLKPGGKTKRQLPNPLPSPVTGQDPGGQDGKEEKGPTPANTGKTPENAQPKVPLTDEESLVLQIIIDNDIAAPCNESYVSKACAVSKTGIVHEDPKSKLGELLPANHPAGAPLPPIPLEFIRVAGNGLSENLARADA